MTKKVNTKDPFSYCKDFGPFSITALFNISEKYPATTVAMGEVQKSEVRDDIQRKNGEDDYTISFLRMMNAYDTFIKESTNEKRSGGHLDNFDLNSDIDFTIYLLWEIRNICTHKGSLIDNAFINRMNKKLAISEKMKISPKINIPSDWEINRKIVIDFETYKGIKKCIFNYIEKNSSIEDRKILHKWSCVSLDDINLGFIVYQIENYHLYLNFKDIQAAKLKIKTNEYGISLPQFTYYPDKNIAIFKRKKEVRAFHVNKFNKNKKKKIKRMINRLK